MAKKAAPKKTPAPKKQKASPKKTVPKKTPAAKKQKATHSRPTGAYQFDFWRERHG